jgi:hypothetical protein
MRKESRDRIRQQSLLEGIVQDFSYKIRRQKFSMISENMADGNSEHLVRSYGN